MWLITSFAAASIVTATWAISPKKYRLDSLTLMLWGLTIMVLMDHVLGYNGGPFIQTQTTGLIQNGTLLGIAMLAPVFAVWGIMLATSTLRGEISTR
ncbi:Uncharacterised protein [uncultured archaeon]|nr:Uncharacterised protein [uncultured archaeon]